MTTYIMLMSAEITANWIFKAFSDFSSWVVLFPCTNQPGYCLCPVFILMLILFSYRREKKWLAYFSRYIMLILWFLVWYRNLNRYGMNGKLLLNWGKILLEGPINQTDKLKVKTIYWSPNPMCLRNTRAVGSCYHTLLEICSAKNKMS